MLSYLKSVVDGILITIVTLVFSVAGIVTWPLSPSGDFYLKLARWWSQFSFWLTNVHVTVGGRERIDWSRPYVFMANHQSSADIMMTFVAVPTPVRLLSKLINAFIPIFGWGMALGRFPFINRNNRRKAFRSLDRAAERVHAGESLLIFPEGTRSDDGVIQEFKKGGFVLAAKANVAVLPLAIIGSNKCLAKGNVRIYPGRIHAEFGTPIEPGEIDIKKRHELAERVRAQLEEMVGDNTVDGFLARQGQREAA